jgi:hypothetical protein
MLLFLFVEPSKGVIPELYGAIFPFVLPFAELLKGAIPEYGETFPFVLLSLLPFAELLKGAIPELYGIMPLFPFILSLPFAPLFPFPFVELFKGDIPEYGILRGCAAFAVTVFSFVAFLFL